VEEARELNRLRYLAAMGITPLVSRRPLPGAKATRKLALRSPPEAPVSVPQPAAAPAPAAGEQRSAGARLAADLRRDERSMTAPAPVETAPAAPATSATPAERFRLAVLFAGDRLWLEDMGEDALARDQVDLVEAIVAALRHPESADARPDVRQFDWPLHGNAQLDLGPDEAASALAGFLGRQISEREPVEIVCLGAEAARRLRGLDLGCALRELPSTRQMLSEPLVKRRAWHALKS
jgi:hypothetical protein